MKKIYFVRHGETHANVKGIVSGGENDTSLTTNGKSQAKEAGATLKNKGIELIVSSPQKRAIQTAEIIAQEIGYGGDIKIVETFREHLMGPYSGKPRELFIAHQESGKLLDGTEGHENFHARVKSVVKELSEFKEAVILVVAHGGVSRMVKVVASNMPHDHFHVVDRLKNAEIYEFELE